VSDNGPGIAARKDEELKKKRFFNKETV